MDYFHRAAVGHPYRVPLREQDQTVDAGVFVLLEFIQRHALVAWRDERLDPNLARIAAMLRRQLADGFGVLPERLRPARRRTPSVISARHALQRLGAQCSEQNRRIRL